jgi:hypothetical protein
MNGYLGVFFNPGQGSRGLTPQDAVILPVQGPPTVPHGAFYDPAQAVNGRCAIMGTFSGEVAPTETRAFLETGEHDRNYSETHCVDVSGATPVLVEALPMTAIWDQVTQTLSGLPEPCLIWIDGVFLETCTDGMATFGGLLHGSYKLQVRAVGFTPKTFAVTV